ncbi:peroxisomal membrane protein PMP22-like [Glycine soja]|uniref:peroxisomal membrane protein PMP22-like n=1 Tax=Glycine soja TaxID=3848 RepID=UPI00103C8237|nr:peroxisomal membrane protein PMP22-like [Glycine soja]
MQTHRWDCFWILLLCRQEISVRRVLLFMLYGFAYSGPFGHFLHKLMDKIFKGEKGNDTVAKKVILEQITNSPWNKFLFMMYYGLVIEDFETKINLLKLAHFAVIIYRQYSKKEAAVGYLGGVIRKLQAI